MRGRRIARRIASMRAPENPRTDAGCCPTLATKVFHLLFQFFLVCPGTGQWQTAERRMADAQGHRQGSSAGVWPSPQTLNTCRLASITTLSTTPFNTPTLVAKGSRNGVVS
jgi:hypothetical protein